MDRLWPHQSPPGEAQFDDAIAFIDNVRGEVQKLQM